MSRERMYFMECRKLDLKALIGENVSKQGKQIAQISHFKAFFFDLELPEKILDWLTEWMNERGFGEYQSTNMY